MPESRKTLLVAFQVILSVVIVSQIASGVGIYWATGSLVGIVDKLLLRLSLKLWPVFDEVSVATSSPSSE